MKRIFGQLVVGMILCLFAVGNVFSAEKPKQKNDKYRTVCGYMGYMGSDAPIADGLDNKVNELMKSGWKPAGGGSVVNVAQGMIMGCQSMTR